MSEPKNVYIDFPKSFVKEVEYVNRNTGMEDKFYSITLPRNTMVAGQDVSYYQFTSNFANPSQFLGENFVTIPVSKDYQIPLKKTVFDEMGQPVMDEAGNYEKDTVLVSPQELRQGVIEGRRAYAAERESLDSRADHAREGAETLGKAEGREPEKAQVR